MTACAARKGPRGGETRPCPGEAVYLVTVECLAPGHDSGPKQRALCARCTAQVRQNVLACQEHPTLTVKVHAARSL